MKLNIGDVFVPCQVWKTPRGGLWKVLRYEYGNDGKCVLMRQGEDGNGRKQYRAWDAVGSWTIWIHADGELTDAAKKSRAEYA